MKNSPQERRYIRSMWQLEKKNRPSDDGARPVAGRRATCARTSDHLQRGNIWLWSNIGWSNLELQSFDLKIRPRAKCTTACGCFLRGLGRADDSETHVHKQRDVRHLVVSHTAIQPYKPGCEALPSTRGTGYSYTR